MTLVTITQNDKSNSEGRTWSYNVNYEGQRAGEAYTVRARHLEDHYLLEEKYGSASQEPFHLFGIENRADYQKADTRLYSKAKKRANEVMDFLIPELEDKTSQASSSKGGKK